MRCPLRSQPGPRTCWQVFGRPLRAVVLVGVARIVREGAMEDLRRRRDCCAILCANMMSEEVERALRLILLLLERGEVVVVVGGILQ